MIRVLIFFIVLALAAFGLMWLADNPGEVAVTFRGYEYDVSLTVALFGIVIAAIVLSILWGLIRFIFRIPSLMSLAAKARRREKGFGALSRGMIAVGAGDAQAAIRHAADAAKLIGDEPLTKLLKAQAAQIGGDRQAAIAAFNAMLDHPATHALGLRGLHVEARRAGDHEAALHYAERAHAHSALPWAGHAVLEERAKRGDWVGALAAVEANAAARSIDKPTANRLRAILKTAIAEQLADSDPRGALTLVEEARRMAPGLIPAAALCGRLSASLGDLRHASHVLEAAYEKSPHPDLAIAYLYARVGDSGLDRLARARRLARLAPYDPESAMTIARAAVDARDLAAARSALSPLIAPGAERGRPTARVCLLMAEVEQAAGAEGAVREWLARAATAPRDRAWVGEGIITDKWAPATPSGALDAFQWRTPDERLTAPAESPALRTIEAAPTIPANPAAVAAPAPAIPPPAPAAPPRPPERPAPAPAGARTAALRASLPDDPGPMENKRPTPVDAGDFAAS